MTKNIAMFFVALSIILLGGCSQTVPKYEADHISASVVRFDYEAFVRREPGVSSDEYPNQCGYLSESGFTMEIASGTILVQEDLYNVANGNFYGFTVDDIMATPEGRSWFPKGIDKDEDDIVWVNAQYVEIILE